MRLLIIASRLMLAASPAKLKQKYPELSDEIEILGEEDPSSKWKYLEWQVKQLLAGAEVESLVGLTEKFHKNSGRLKNKDINKYDSESLERELKSLSPSKTMQRKETKLQGAKKIFEDDESLLIKIDDHRACVQYGSNTKWCITQSDGADWDNYSSRNVKFYFLVQKELPVEDIHHKVAIAVTCDEDNNPVKVDLYDSEDKLISQSGFSKWINIAEKDAANSDYTKEYKEWVSMS